jgi:hypothetical protein
VQASGNNIENFQGNVYINKTSYQNSKGIYDFDDFTSSFDSNNVRTITVNSPDIVEGEIVGKYEFNQLENLVKNFLEVCTQISNQVRLKGAVSSIQFLYL